MTFHTLPCPDARPPLYMTITPLRLKGPENGERVMDFEPRVEHTVPLSRPPRLEQIKKLSISISWTHFSSSNVQKVRCSFLKRVYSL